MGVEVRAQRLGGFGRRCKRGSTATLLPPTPTALAASAWLSPLTTPPRLWRAYQMQSEVFRVSLTQSEALLGDPYIATAESLQVYAVRDWQPWNVRLHRYGAVTVELRNSDSDARADIEVQVDSDAGRDALASAVVAYVAGLGDFTSSATYGEWCGSVLERVAGALTAAQRKHAERMATLAAEVA